MAVYLDITYKFRNFAIRKILRKTYGSTPWSNKKSLGKVEETLRKT